MKLIGIGLCLLLLGMLSLLIMRQGPGVALPLPHQGSVANRNDPNPFCGMLPKVNCMAMLTAFPDHNKKGTSPESVSSYQQPSKHMSLDAPQVPEGQHSVVGSPPSYVNAHFIDTILARAGSPDAGLGQYFIRYGQEYNLNPLYALAFYHHESSYGTTGMAVATLSISNMRCTDAYQCTNGYAQMPDRIAGIKLWFSLIRETYINAWGLSTVEQIVPVYAPRADHNNPVAYIDAVNSDVAQWSGQ